MNVVSDSLMTTDPKAVKLFSRVLKWAESDVRVIPSWTAFTCR